MADKKRWCLKYPWLIKNAVLNQGYIEAKVIHERGEIVLAAPYISLIGPSATS